MDPHQGNSNNNRLHMNFGFSDRAFTAPNSAYPTTPSTFPQPLYSAHPQDFHDRTQQANYGQGYFVNNPYAQQQPHAQYGYAGLASPQPTYQGRGGYDVTNGLAQQFSNQDLSSSPRVGMLRPSPQSSRPRTPNAGHGHLSPAPPRSPKPTEEEELVKKPEMYSENIHKRGRAAKELVNVFFRENIERARDRNLRLVPMNYAQAGRD